MQGHARKENTRYVAKPRGVHWVVEELSGREVIIPMRSLHLFLDGRHQLANTDNFEEVV